MNSRIAAMAAIALLAGDGLPPIQEPPPPKKGPPVDPLARGKNPGRNAPCPCGSGKKFKKCCIGKPVA